MAIVSATDLQIKSMTNGGTAAWSDPSSGGYQVGLLSGINSVICLKFTIASAAEGLILNFKTYGTAYLDIFNWAITSAESSTYANATASTVGEGQIGGMTATAANSHKLFKTLSAGTYYLYLWTTVTSNAPTTIMAVTMTYGSYSDFVGTVDFRSYADGSPSFHWRTSGSYSTSAGWSVEGLNWVTVFRFVTPSRAKNVKLSFCISSSATSSGASIRYKLVSGAEDSSLINADSSTSADGTYTMATSFSNLDRVDITISKNIPTGVHYLYLWTNEAIGTHNSIGIIYNAYTTDTTYTYVTYEEGGSGAVPIFNGSSIDPHDSGIFNGTGWDLCDPYIFDGTDWVPYDGG